MVAAGCALPEQELQAAAGRVLPEKGTGGSRGLCTTPEQERVGAAGYAPIEQYRVGAPGRAPREQEQVATTKWTRMGAGRWLCDAETRRGCRLLISWTCVT